MRFVKPVAAILAVAMAATSLVSVADARHRQGQHYRYYRGGYHHHGDAFFAGAAGFAAGAVLGSLAAPRYYYDGYAPGYYAQPYYAPAPVYVAPPAAYYQEQPGYYGCDSSGSVSRPANSMC